MFKSFNPPKFATKGRNNYNNQITLRNIKLDELCSSCGYPYGYHYGTTCPTKEDILVKNDHIIPYHAPKKLTKREQSIRAFRKFLYDNDALEQWYANRRAYKWRRRGNLFTGLSINRYIIGAFEWSTTKEGDDYWVKLDIEWYRIISSHEDYL